MTSGPLGNSISPAAVPNSSLTTDVDEHNQPSPMADAVAAHQEKVMQLLQQHGIVCQYDEKQSCFSLHGNVDADAYKIAMFKVLPCKKRYNHDWTACPYAHPNERARRRCLLISHYHAKVCPDMQNKGECPRGEDCPMTHSMFEYWMHPQRYRSKLCREGVKCSRIYCFFAHTSEELRVPCDGPFTLHPLQPCSNHSSLAAINNQSFAISACTLPAQYGLPMQQPTFIPMVSNMPRQHISSMVSAADPGPNMFPSVGAGHSSDLAINAGTAANQLVLPALHAGLQLAANGGSSMTGHAMYFSGASDSPFAHAGSSSSNSSTCTNVALPMTTGTSMWMADGMTALMPQQKQEQQQINMSTLHGWYDQSVTMPQLQMASASADASLAAQLNQLQLQTGMPPAGMGAPNSLGVFMSNNLGASAGLTTVPGMGMMPTGPPAAAALRTMQLQDSSSTLAFTQQGLLQQQQQMAQYPMWPSRQ